MEPQCTPRPALVSLHSQRLDEESPAVSSLKVQPPDRPFD